MIRGKNYFFVVSLVVFIGIASGHIGLINLPNRVRIAFDSLELSDPIGCVYN